MKQRLNKPSFAVTACVVKLQINATATTQWKFDVGVTDWSVDDFDSMEIQSSSSTKFDDA